MTISLRTSLVRMEEDHQVAAACLIPESEPKNGDESPELPLQ